MRAKIKNHFFFKGNWGWLPMVTLLFLLGCVAGEGGKKKASCSPGQTFDTISRKCSGATTSFNQAPVPTLTSHSILEDSGTSSITLRYSDVDNDFATSCNVTAPNSNGIKKNLTTQGLLFESQDDIIDPHNTRVTFNSGIALSVTTSTAIPSLRQIIVTVAPTSNTIAVANAINLNATASAWLTAAPLVNQTVVGTGETLALDQLSCSCFGGVCKTSVTPVTDFYGTTDFTYTVTDKDGTSNPQLVQLNITSVNDDPNITLLSSINATEKYDHDTSGTPSATGNLVNDGVVSIEDSSDGDPFGSLLSFQVVAAPAFGTLTLDSSGNYAYETYAEQATDSFQVRVIDPQGGTSSNATITVNITNVNDPPVGTLTSIPNITEDGSAGLVTLTYEDEEDAENDSAIKCVISSVDKVYPDGGCFCAAGVCQVIINALPNRTGTGSFGYKIYDASIEPPQETIATFNIDAVADDPIVFPTVATTTLIQGLESETFEPNTYTFTLDGATDDDGHSILSYSLTTPPANGSLSGCLGQGASGLSCTYTPSDGNLADGSVLDGTPPSVDLAQAATDTGTFYATTLGESYDGLSIELKNVRNTDESINTLYGANAVAYTDGDKVVILFQSSLTTGADISSAIDANANVSKLVDFDPGLGTQTSTGTISLASGTSTADKFTFQALDSSGATNTKTVHISLIPVNDRPTVCEYSSYSETTVCGLNGCIANTTPTSITPDQDGLTFYSLATGACYESSNGAWVPVESKIKDRVINELDPIVIDNIKVDEGGGSAEDSEELSITNIDSSDENLVPLGNIEVIFDGQTIPKRTGATTPFTLTGSAGTSADLKDLRIIITPQTINPPASEKVSDIEITVADDTGKVTEVTFRVTVQKVSATHGGWVSFKATGPKVDALGLVNEDRTVCPYSLDMCEGGQKCSGSSSPVNNTSADPDHVDAIFLQSSGSTQTCYRMKRNQIQNLAYVGKTSNTVSIEYVEGSGAASDTASVSVSGNAITVTMYDDVTTTDTIVSAIEGNASAHALVKVINLKSNETQDTPLTATSVTPLSNSSWESFETYCSVTPAALETGCSVGGKLSCIGTGTPSGVITPTRLDSRFWDEENNVCYRSTGTSNTDWVAYDAPAEVKISWNQFSINGSGSVSEYKVFRRLADEEFDFSKPINKESITGSSLTYSFTDNAKNSVTPPAPGTAYYYVVRPVVSGILTSTAAETGTNAIGIVRMLAPPKNMAFAHRWMINKQICSLMNLTSDATNNYRCAYKGAGDLTASSGSQVYDYGQDLLVDRFEAGCAFSEAPNCPGTFDNSCIGVNNPNTAGITPTANLVYYSRGEGLCYVANGAAWIPMDSTVFANYFSNVEPNTVNLTSDPQFDSNSDKKYHRASLPPLTNITQGDANTFCSNLEDLPVGEILGINDLLKHRLPKRKDQVAYSLWDDNELTDSTIATTETGLSLNSSSKCNSSGASGLEDGYVDFDKPDSNDFYSLPGTSSSGIRSITTGSNETAACTSLFGVQDAVGNVAEWTSHGFNCPLLSTCHGNENLVIQDIEYVRIRSASTGLAVGIFYERSQPYAQVQVDTPSAGVRLIRVDLDDFAPTATAASIVDAINDPVISSAPTLVTARVINDPDRDQMRFGATAYFGLEVDDTDDTDFISSDTTDDYGYWTLDGLRGPCVDSDADGVCDGNISFWAIEDERFSAGRFMTPMGLPAHVSSNSTFSTDYDLFEIGPTSGITSLKLHDDTVNFNSRIIAADPTGCGGLTTGGSYLSGNGAGVWNLEALPCTGISAFGVLTIQDITYRASSSADLNITVRYVESSLTITNVQLSGSTLFVDLDDLPDKSASTVSTFVNAEGTLESFVSGDPASNQAAFSSPVSFTDLEDEAVSQRVDVGFRCMIDVPHSNYDE